jgi:hypothetical protein
MNTHTVLLEVRVAGSADAARQAVDALLPPHAHRDEDFEPVFLSDGQTWIVRCVLADASEVATLEAHPDVVGVWPDSTIAPM